MQKSDPNIQKLLMKFAKNRCNTKEIDIIIDYFRETEGTHKFPDFDEVLQMFDVIPDIKEERAKEIYTNILKYTRYQKTKIGYKKIIRYAAAAVLIGLLTTSYFFVKNTFDLPEDDKDTPSIVNTESIKPGTDRAVLTLEDGSQIALEKGGKFKTRNALSNGEKITYENNNEELAEMVYNDLTVPRGGQFSIELSDGTKVWLNSESKLKYPISFLDGETRKVELLYGEAYFDVSPSIENNDSKFIVVTDHQEIEVLGTEFNVKSYKGESKVYTTVVEGKVSVENQFGIYKNLTPNQQSILNIGTDKIEITLVDATSETSWIRGVFNFENKPLKDVMRVLSRWYDVDFVFVNSDLEAVKFNGSLNKDRNIERILSLMLSKRLNSYEIKGKTIILK